MPLLSISSRWFIALAQGCFDILKAFRGDVLFDSELVVKIVIAPHAPGDLFERDRAAAAIDGIEGFLIELVRAEALGFLNSGAVNTAAFRGSFVSTEYRFQELCGHRY